MKQISEYTLIGSYLILSVDKFGMDSIKYENAKAFSEKVLAKLNKKNISYTLQPVEEKMTIIKQMISKGVFKTDPSNKAMPFKQIYNFEVSKHILAVFSFGGNLVFKLPKIDDKNPSLEKSIRETYSTNLSLDVKNAIISTINEQKPKTR